MTFNNIQNGDPLDPSKVMENFRHRNFGSDLLPSDASGNPVDNTLDLGSATYAWKDAYVNNLIVNGEFSVANQPVLVVYNGSVTFNQTLNKFSSYTEAANVGTFTTTSGKLTPPSAGIYSVDVSFNVTNNDSRTVIGWINVFNSSDVQKSRFMVSLAAANGNFKGACNVHIASGDYITLGIQHTTSGGTGTAAEGSVSIVKIF